MTSFPNKDNSKLTKLLIILFLQEPYYTSFEVYQSIRERRSAEGCLGFGKSTIL